MKQQTIEELKRKVQYLENRYYDISASVEAAEAVLVDLKKILDDEPIELPDEFNPAIPKYVNDIRQEVVAELQRLTLIPLDPDEKAAAYVERVQKLHGRGPVELAFNIVVRNRSKLC